MGEEEEDGSLVPLNVFFSFPQNGAKFNVKGFHNPPLVNNPVLSNRGHTHIHAHTQYHRNTWRRRKRDSLPVSLSREKPLIFPWLPLSLHLCGWRRMQGQTEDHRPAVFILGLSRLSASSLCVLQLSISAWLLFTGVVFQYYFSFFFLLLEPRSQAAWGPVLLF